jgi:peptidoglycan/LPS O-acetylase OafA/YrhL
MAAIDTAVTTEAERLPVAHVPDVVAPPPGNPRFPLLDAVRALAVLSILVFHAAGTHKPGFPGDILQRLDVGVAVFFVLSGFLLYRPFVNARLLDGPRIGIAGYARRRALRILPAYWVALTAIATWPGLSGVLGDRWWSFYGLLQVYDFDTTVQGLGVAWSLCIEVSFYVLLPFYALAASAALGRRSARARVTIELSILAALSVASVALRYRLREHDPLSPALHTLPTHLWWFAVGMGLAILSVARSARGADSAPIAALRRRPALSWVAAAVAFGVMCVAAARLHDDANGGAFGFVSGSEDLVVHVLYGLVALFLIAPAVFADGSTGLPQRVLALQPLTWLGLVSYGIFLYQVPVIQELDRVGVSNWLGGLHLVALSLAATAVTAAIAAVSYYLVERPLLRFKFPARARG